MLARCNNKRVSAHCAEHITEGTGDCRQLSSISATLQELALQNKGTDVLPKLLRFRTKICSEKTSAEGAVIFYTMSIIHFLINHTKILHVCIVCFYLRNRTFTCKSFRL
jgi:hypothetical protein